MSNHNCPFCGSDEVGEIFDASACYDYKLKRCAKCKIIWPINKHAEICSMRRKAEAWDRARYLFLGKSEIEFSDGFLNILKDYLKEATHEN